MSLMPAKLRSQLYNDVNMAALLTSLELVRPLRLTIVVQCINALWEIRCPSVLRDTTSSTFNYRKYTAGTGLR